MVFKSRVFYCKNLPKKIFQRKNSFFLIDRKSGVRLRQKNVFYLSGGESVKNFKTLEKVLRKLLEQDIDRKGELIVIGGGAVLDLGALAASLYLRGIRLTLIPTTLLSMVDATFGGKTAIDGKVNGLLTKNSFGSFYSAHEIWICTRFLETLSHRERVSGVGELMKALWIGRRQKMPVKSVLYFLRSGKADQNFFSAIRYALRVKEEIVKKDFYDEKNQRIVLNLGHTVGHILESLTKNLSHGEAILWGIAVEGQLFAGSAQAKEAAQVLKLMGCKIPRGFKEKQTKWKKLFKADKKRSQSMVSIPILNAKSKMILRQTNILAKF